jgi:tetratricopeptide (TPR) repeat protein
VSNTTVDQTIEAAVAHHRAGRLAEAESLYRDALAQSPQHDRALYLFGHLLYSTGRLDPAIELMRQATVLRPEIVHYHADLGNAFAAAGRTDEAIAMFRAALALKPDHARVWNQLGTSLHDAGRFEEAVGAHRNALTHEPGFVEAQNNLGNALQNLRRWDEAIAMYHTALQARPDYPEACNNLGCALKETDHWDEAIAAFRRAIALQHDYPAAHWNLATALLTVGQLREGWREYEWRSHYSTAPRPRQFAQPRWNGEPLNGQRILLHAEQGFGDTIQFARYAKLVAARGGRVLLECQPALVRLTGRLDHVDRIIAEAEPSPPFDLHCPLLSCPLVFETDLESIPAEVSYLCADPRDAEAWHARLADDSSSIKVGLAWAGSNAHINDRNRSLTPAQLRDLLTVSGFSFYSLQVGPRSSEAAQLPGVRDLTADLHDFADTAALIENLDLVITVDTVVAHLAGALGKRTWILLPTPGDFRWLLHREDSPWYPTARLFRQPTPGDWATPLRRLRDELSQLARPQ